MVRGGVTTPLYAAGALAWLALHLDSNSKPSSVSYRKLKVYIQSMAFLGKESFYDK